MIAYTAMKAYATLYSSYNEIDIYVEDSTLVGMYERLFKRLFADRYRVEAIIPFGKKGDVLAEAERLAEDASRKRLFIVDGDFDWVHRPAKARNVYELQQYSVENFIFDDDALLSFAGEADPSKTVSDVISLLALDQLQSEIEALLPLMRAYMLARLLGSEIQTVSYSIERLRNTRRKLDKHLIGQKVIEVYKNLIRDFGPFVVRDFYNAMIDQLHGIENLPRRIIAGKHYGLKIVMSHLQKNFKFTGRGEQLLANIIERSSLQLDPNFLRMIADL